MSVREKTILDLTNTTLNPKLTGANLEMLGDGASEFSTLNQDKPLVRVISATIRANLSDLITDSSGKATWAPRKEVLENIFRQSKFVSLDGRTEKLGNMNSVVVHSIEASNWHSDFPIALGVKISGVENLTFASTGSPFSMVVYPGSHETSGSWKSLQENDVSVA